MNRERSIFEKALEFTDAKRRGLYLDQTCVDDGELRKRIDALLEKHETTAHFILDDKGISDDQCEFLQCKAELRDGHF